MKNLRRYNRWMRGNRHLSPKEVREMLLDVIRRGTTRILGNVYNVILYGDKPEYYMI